MRETGLILASLVGFACVDASAPPPEHDAGVSALDASLAGPDGALPDTSDSGQEDAFDAGDVGDASLATDGGIELPPRAHRAGSIPIGVENVNDSPLKVSSHRTLLRFVPVADVSIDRFYFGYKLRGANCWDAGNAGYGAGDGGTMEASLVAIDAAGLPGEVLAQETVNGCARHDEAMAEFGSTPVLNWVNTPATLKAGVMYGLVIRNVHGNPGANFFSFNMPLAATEFAGPHARNELDGSAEGGILSLDPREHVAWSEDDGASWRYGSENGPYRSYLNDRDTDHPATRMPQYGYRTTAGDYVPGQPYYAYGITCTDCSVRHEHVRVARTFRQLGGFTADEQGVGTLTVTNDAGERGSCVPPAGFGFRTCTLDTEVSVAAGEGYTVHATGTVEVMKMDRSQRVLFPSVGQAGSAFGAHQLTPATGTNREDVPSLWAGPRSTAFED